MRLAAPALALAATLLAACGRSKPHEAAAPAGATAGGPAAAPSAATAYVNAPSALRREPTEAPRVAAGAKQVSNFLAMLQRGEKVNVVEPRDEWAKVRASDETEGWLRRASLVEGEGVTEATVLAPADVFDRPDLLAANARRKIDPGTLVLVVKVRPPFAEVNVAGSQDAWVLSERLATGEKEVSVAKLTEKARWLVRAGKKDEALQILALARDHFAGVPLVDLLAAELGEAAAPAPGGVVPASGAPVSPVAVPPAAPGQ